ncbi:MAG: hypothetical protein D6B27_04870 [Gammaproteobacteria bacterium]|nr:MAG: hypothetical protein D6B27_04870 [Gammaproteobacteria bacterium]
MPESLQNSKALLWLIIPVAILTLLIVKQLGKFSRRGNVSATREVLWKVALIVYIGVVVWFTFNFNLDN